MRQWWGVSISVLGAGAIVAVTLLHYFNAQRLGVPGGYLMLALGSVATGSLAALAGLIAVPADGRRALVAISVAVIVSLVSAGIVLTALILAFGV